MPEKMYGALFLLYKMEYILRGFALTEIENHDTVNIVRGNNSYTLLQQSPALEAPAIRSGTHNSKVHIP